MSTKKFLYVANWKMQLTHQQAYNFISQHKQNLNTLTQHTQQLIICPSFDALSTLRTELKDTSITLGAQTCSAHELGAYTGQVSAISLKELGCTHVILGHSEQKKYTHETLAELGLKIAQAMKTGLIPITCVGETKAQKAQGQTQKVLEEQLDVILEHIMPNKPFIIAYEPEWAIGTETAASEIDIIQAFTLIIAYVKGTKPLLLYGGSVDEVAAGKLKKIPELAGFLLGRASLDFQKLQNIVLS